MFHPSVIVCVAHSLLNHLKLLQLALEQSEEADLQKLPVAKPYSPSCSFIMAPGLPGCSSVMAHICRHPPGIHYEPDISSFPVFS